MLHLMKPTTTTSQKGKRPNYSKISYVTHPSQQEESDFSDNLLLETLRRLNKEKAQPKK